MVDAATIVSIVIAVVSFLGTLVVAFIGHLTARKLQNEAHLLDAKLEEKREERQDARDLAALTSKYSQPLLVAAYELQARLYELLELPISREHLDTEEGLEDIKIYTCYKYAQFLAWTGILKSKTQYFSFTNDENLKKMGDLILRIDEELDRRRGNDGQNLGVWPGYRILVSERMIRTTTSQGSVGNVPVPISVDTTVKGYNEFLSEWESSFRQPMGYICQMIDDLILGRKNRKEHWDDSLRCTQHNLVDMVQYLDHTKVYAHLRRCAEPWFCDCTACNPTEREKPLETRWDSRSGDKGLRPWFKTEGWNREYDQTVELEKVTSMTCLKGFNQSIAG